MKWVAGQGPLTLDSETICRESIILWVSCMEPWTIDPIDFPTASLVSRVKLVTRMLWSSTQKLIEAKATRRTDSTSTACWKTTKVLSYDQSSNSKTLSKSIASSNSISNKFPPMSLNLNSLIGFQRGLKVRVIASLFTTLLVNFFAANQYRQISRCLETSAPCSSSSVSDKQARRSLMLAMPVEKKQREQPS